MEINFWQPISSLTLVDLLVILGISIFFDTGYSFVLKVIVVLAYRITSSTKRSQKYKTANKIIKEKKRLTDNIENLRQKLAMTTDLAASTRLEIEISAGL